MAAEVLRSHADGLKELAELLLEREVVFTEDVERIFGKRKKDILRERKEAEQKALAERKAASGDAEEVVGKKRLRRPMSEKTKRRFLKPPHPLCRTENRLRKRPKFNEIYPKKVELCLIK